MLRFIKALVMLVVAVVVILLAVANRGLVQLSLDPFSAEAPELAYQVPLYAVIFAAVALGVVIGGIGAWLAQSKHRRAEREYRREVRDLRQETERLRRQRAAATGVPALPPVGSSAY